MRLWATVLLPRQPSLQYIKPRRAIDSVPKGGDSGIRKEEEEEEEWEGKLTVRDPIVVSHDCV